MFFKNTQHKLMDDIKPASNWFVMAMYSSGYSLDYSIESLKEIDRFFDEQHTGILSENVGKKLFSIGCYVGETIRKTYDGTWIADDNTRGGERRLARVTEGHSRKSRTTTKLMGKRANLRPADMLILSGTVH